MKEQVRFLNMFSQYQPPEGLQDILSRVAVVVSASLQGHLRTLRPAADEYHCDAP